MSNLLTLLSGTRVAVGERQSYVLPEVHDLAIGDVVTLENEQREFIGVGEVVNVTVETFALLQQAHFRGNAHPDMGAWHTAFETLQKQVPGFSQNDKVTVVVVKVAAASDVGLTVNTAPPDKEFAEQSARILDADITPESVADIAVTVQMDGE
jgi:hypothetical protein